MMFINVKCPNCGKEARAPETALKRLHTCSKCKKEVVLKRFNKWPQFDMCKKYAICAFGITVGAGLGVSSLAVGWFFFFGTLRAFILS